MFLTAVLLGAWSAAAVTRLRLPLSGDWLREPPSGGTVLCERELAVPAESAVLRPLLVFRLFNARADISVDGRNVGSCTFPGGSVDLSGRLPAGKTVRLGVCLSDTSGSSKYGIRGVSGETYLEFVPRDGWIREVFVRSVSPDEVLVVAELSEGLKDRSLTLAVDVDGCGTSRRFLSEPSEPDAAGRLTCRVRWPEAKKWDLHTPGNRYAARVSVLDADGRTVDAHPPVPFGFRCFAVVGRGFELNGIPLRLRGFYTRLINGRAEAAEPSALREAVRRLRWFGGNFLITGNFGFACGDQRSPDDLLRICDEEGVLTAFSLPHCKDFWLFPCFGKKLIGISMSSESAGRRLSA